ncbi:Peptidyl-prolyl cis-trans isomerase CYP40 [Hordeum vulgare]|nr:Peptidyl-prolyl cis-trans isomerase CYP40 [Hordeum vulgare]
MALRVRNAPWASSDENMARRAHRARQRAREAVQTFAAVDVGEAESHSPVPHMLNHFRRRKRVMVDAGSSEKGSGIDLTSNDTIWVTKSSTRKSRAWETAEA